MTYGVGDIAVATFGKYSCPDSASSIDVLLFIFCISGFLFDFLLSHLHLILACFYVFIFLAVPLLTLQLSFMRRDRQMHNSGHNFKLESFSFFSNQLFDDFE